MHIKAFDWSNIQNPRIKLKMSNLNPKNGFVTCQKGISQRGKKWEPSTRTRGLGEICVFARACLFRFSKKAMLQRSECLVSKLNPKIGTAKVSHDKTNEFQIPTPKCAYQSFWLIKNAKSENKIENVESKPEKRICHMSKRNFAKGQKMGALDEDPGVGGNMCFCTCLFVSFFQKSNVTKKRMLSFKIKP